MAARVRKPEPDYLTLALERLSAEGNLLPDSVPVIRLPKPKGRGKGRKC